MARKFVWVDRSSDISVLNGIAPQMPLKRICTFWIAGSGTSFSNVPTIFSAKLTKSALARVHNLRNREMRINSVIFTVSNPCIL